MTEACVFPNSLLAHVLVLVVIYISGTHENETTNLSLNPVEAYENANVKLTCSYSGPLAGEGFMWILHTSGSKPTKYESVVANNCNILPGFLGNSDLYSYSCISSTTHYVILRNVKQQNHGEVWQCGIVINDYRDWSNNVTLLVTVPVTKVHIIPHEGLLTIAENSTFTLTCSTSPCRPKPMFLWYIINDNNPEESRTILSKIISTELSTDELTQYTNNISIKLNWTWNIRLLFCGANNSKGDLILSDKVLLNVTYPPNGPPGIEHFKNGSEINVIQERFVYLKCLITGGNPLPGLEWNKNNDKKETVSGSDVSKDLRYQAIEKKNEELICRGIQSNLTYTTYVSVNVLYPPETPTIKIKTSSGTFLQVYKTLHVIEGLPFTLNCSADSNPPVSLFQWNNLMPTVSSIFYVANADRRNAEHIACEVSNTMQTSDSSTSMTGSNITSLEVNVLYPPTINNVKEANIIEGDNLDNLCNFIPGNPPDTNITWSWKGSTWNVNTQQPHIVSRNQSGEYRCSVRNLMISSDGTRVIGNASGDFNLFVQYKTKVLRFVINEQHDKVNITVNENEAVNLTCEIEGLPLPKGLLIHQRFLNQQVMELPRYLTNQASTNLRLTSSFPAQCTDTGIQTCSGTNILYNGRQSTSNKSIALFVMCSDQQCKIVTSSL